MQYCCYDEVRLIGRDNNGNQFMNTLIGAGSYMNYAKVSVTEKQTLLIYAGTSIVGCDVGGNEFYIREVDTIGNILWADTVSKQVYALLPLPSGNRVMFVKESSYFFGSVISLMHNLNANGQILSTYTINSVSGIDDACILNNGNILLSYNQGTLKEIDTLGNQINLMPPLGAPLTNLYQSPTGNIYCIDPTFGALIKLSPTYSILASNAGSLHYPNAYYYKNDTIYTCGDDADGNYAFFLLDTALNVIHQSTSNLEQITCTGITVDNTNIVKILTYGSSNSEIIGSHTFSGYFHTSAFGNLNGTKDIGIVKAEIDSVRIQPLTGGISLNNYNMIARAKVTVKNFGDAPIKNFKLNYYFLYISFSYCLVGLNQYHEIELQPGDTATVITGFFNSPFSLWNSSTYTANICIYTSVPDSTNDYEVSNNTKCASKVIYGVGIKEYSHETELNIFPNPSGGVVNINASEAITKLEIFDYSGKQVGLYFPNNQNFELKENTLAAGLYVFKITTANSTVVRKVVIE